jgi:malonyl CoA-acyl carrier protein transacylase
MAIAWVFPGQGSQKIGMAEAVLELPGARERFERGLSPAGPRSAGHLQRQAEGSWPT